MKKLLLIPILLLLLISNVYAQFNGIIKYEIDLQGEGADQYSAFMPTHYLYQFSGVNMKFKLEGGMTAAMLGDVLFLGKSSEVYMVKDNEKKAYLMPKDVAGSDDEQMKQEITKENETMTIKGYECQKYIVLSENNEGSTQQVLWTTTEISPEKPKSKKARQNSGNIFIEGVDGFPLKIETTLNMAGSEMIMTVTAVEIEEKDLDKSNFQIPSEYTIEDYTPPSFGGNN